MPFTSLSAVSCAIIHRVFWVLRFRMDFNDGELLDSFDCLVCWKMRAYIVFQIPRNPWLGWKLLSQISVQYQVTCGHDPKGCLVIDY